MARIVLCKHIYRLFVFFVCFCRREGIWTAIKPIERTKQCRFRERCDRERLLMREIIVPVLTLIAQRQFSERHTGGIEWFGEAEKM